VPFFVDRVAKRIVCPGDVSLYVISGVSMVFALSEQRDKGELHTLDDPRLAIDGSRALGRFSLRCAARGA
jgi:hypothetical protein